MKCTNPELGKFALLSDREPDEKLPDSVREHLSVCDDCADRRKRYLRWRDGLQFDASSHLGTDVLLAYGHVPLTASDQERTDEHLRNCRECSDALDSLNSAFDSIAENVFDSSYTVPDWTAEREQSFVLRTKRVIEARGQLARSPRTTSDERSRPSARSQRGTRPVLVWGIAFATLVAVVTVVFLYARWVSSLKSTNGVNQNSSATLQGSPSPAATGSTENGDLTAHQPAQQPTRRSQVTSSPEPDKPSEAEIKTVALLVDPSRISSDRTQFSVNQPFIRFSVSIKGPMQSESFRFEVIDEETGNSIGGPRKVNAQAQADYRQVDLVLPAKELLHSFYTLRLTGLNAAGETEEVFTIYLKLTK